MSVAAFYRAVMDVRLERNGLYDLDPVGKDPHLSKSPMRRFCLSARRATRQPRYCPPGTGLRCNADRSYTAEPLHPLDPQRETTMQKRRFLSSAFIGAAVGAIPAGAATKSARPATGPVLLTVTGLIGAGNRGPFDPALDQMMGKQKIQFSKAQTFDFAAIAAMPAVTIKPTLEYDSKPHTLKGPLLTDVMKACAANVGAKTAFFLRAVDGYVAQLSAADATRYRFIVATHLDGQPMPLGGLGPLWTVFDADRFPEFASKPVTERFGNCPWATYHIEVKEIGRASCRERV